MGDLQNCAIHKLCKKPALISQNHPHAAHTTGFFLGICPKLQDEKTQTQGIFRQTQGFFG